MDRPLGGVPCVTVVRKTGCGKMYVTDSTLDDFPEVFLRHGKAGGCTECWCQAMGRVISFALRFHNMTLSERRDRIIHALKGVRCPTPMWDGPEQILSCPDGIAQALISMEKSDDKEEKHDES